jgi:hypothetical protein
MAATWKVQIFFGPMNPNVDEALQPAARGSVQQRMGQSSAFRRMHRTLGTNIHTPLNGSGMSPVGGARSPAR